MSPSTTTGCRCSQLLRPTNQLPSLTPPSPFIRTCQTTAPGSSTTCSPSSTITSTSANGLLLPSSPHRSFSPAVRLITESIPLNSPQSRLHVCVQALSLLLAMILRALLSARTMDYDSDEDFVVIRRPLLVAQAPPPPYLPTTADTRGFRPDLWSSRMRHKVTIPLLCASLFLQSLFYNFFFFFFNLPTLIIHYHSVISSMGYSRMQLEPTVKLVLAQIPMSVYRGIISFCSSNAFAITNLQLHKVGHNPSEPY